jgi:hypothetical protein
MDTNKKGSPPKNRKTPTHLPSKRGRYDFPIGWFRDKTTKENADFGGLTAVPPEDIMNAQVRELVLTGRAERVHKFIDECRVRGKTLDGIIQWKKIGRNEYEAKSADGKYDFVIFGKIGDYTVNIFDSSIKDPDKAYITYTTAEGLEDAKKLIMYEEYKELIKHPKMTSDKERRL